MSAKKQVTTPIPVKQLPVKRYTIIFNGPKDDSTYTRGSTWAFSLEDAFEKIKEANSKLLEANISDIFWWWSEDANVIIDGLKFVK